MKKLVLLVFFITLSNAAFGYCLAGRFGKDCPQNKKAYESNQPAGNNVIINNNGALGGPPGYTPLKEDGATINKRGLGDKSKNQGYASYKEHFVYYNYEFWAAPHQEGFSKSTHTANRTLAYEYAFNPFVSFKAQKTDLIYKGIEGSHEMKQDHTLALVNVRIYLLNSFVLRGGIGMGKSEVQSINSARGHKDYKVGGNTEVLQFSVYYLFGDENTMMGVTSTTIQGMNGARNLGSSFYGLSLGLGF